MSVVKTLYEFFGSEVFENVKDFKARYEKTTSEKHTAMIDVADDQCQDASKNFQGMKAPEYTSQQIKLNYCYILFR